MSEQTPHTIERHCDVAIIGGSAAGLAGALQLGRMRRSVIVVDARDPRNAPAGHMHSYLGHEGVTPADFSAIARAEVRSYGGEVLSGRATSVRSIDNSRFRIELTGGHAIIARRVLAATGVIDELPSIDGLAQHWGGAVLHCPFCHGYEVRDQRIVQIVTHPMGLHPAQLFQQLSGQFSLVIHGGVDVDNPDVEMLRAAGANVINGQVDRIISLDDGRLGSVELTNGTVIDADAVVVSTRFRPRIEAFAELGPATTEHPSGLGEVISRDQSGETSVPGLYAAGNLVDPSQQVLHAAADGSRVGGMISFSLARSDIEAATLTSANQVDWDQRYSGASIWSGNPNGTLVTEATGMATGRALDVGAGEGGDSVWLAEQGWEITAVDVSQRAVDQITEVATERSLSIESVRADANAVNPFGGERFDLVTAHYASVPRTPD
ncbi:MAG: FAD-dependent oxidoreductase, partial [Ilumatobacter sp.]